MSLQPLRPTSRGRTVFVDRQDLARDLFRVEPGGIDLAGHGFVQGTALVEQIGDLSHLVASREKGARRIGSDPGQYGFRRC